MMKTVQAIADAVAALGLVLRGGFHPGSDDGVPAMPDGGAASTVLMIGNVGGSGGDPMWRVFAASRHRCAGADPLDDWTRAMIDPLARRVGAAALYPFGAPPHLPFQRWAMRADDVFPSPLGILVHPDYGLWHGYRAALAFAERLDLPPRDRAPSPCATCVDKPCLSTCPVGAFAPGGYDVARCAAHVESPAGAGCLGRGCRARLACPVAPEMAPAPDQARFHMEAFLRGVRRRRP
ncbi:MAG: hypothetical protein L6R19_12715 [Alphaproteobacteria bacterium]|nr:hypothetical protein [Alphaproteobacteria bacterium]